MDSNRPTLKSLDDKISALNEMLYSLQENVLGLENNSQSLTNDLQRQQESLKKQQDATDTSFQQLSELKHSIFAIMALFFGVFAFISIDLNFTKSIFSYSQESGIDIILLVVCFLITQLFFFIFIYIFLLKPFFMISNNRIIDRQNIFIKNKSKILGISCLILCFLVIFLYYKNIKLEKEYIQTIVIQAK